MKHMNFDNSNREVMIMRIKEIKYRWLKFNCEECGEPIQVLLGTWDKVICSCNKIYYIDEIEKKERVKEKRKVVS